jgi:hypothetical protein
MSVDQNEIDFTLNLKINDLDADDLQRLQPLLMRAVADLNRITGNKSGQEILRFVEQLGRSAQETLMVLLAVQAALTPVEPFVEGGMFFMGGYSSSKILSAGAMLGGLGVSMASQTQAGNV